MLEYKAGTTIQAAPEAVWEVLADLARWPEWDPNCERIEGTLMQGGKLTVYTKLSPGRAFPVTVSDLNKGHRMVWSGGMPLGLFKGVRLYQLTAPDSGVTKVLIKETFSGPLLPLIKGSLPDFGEPFRQWCAGLKGRVEGGVA